MLSLDKHIIMCRNASWLGYQEQMVQYCCDSIIRGYKDDNLDDDGTDFHQQHRQWLELLGNNYRINFHGLENYEKL